MNQTGGKTPSTPRLSEYATNALETIRKELRMFSIGDVQNASTTTNGQQIASPHIENELPYVIAHLMNSGYTEEQALAFIKSNGRSDVLDISKQPSSQSSPINSNQRLPVPPFTAPFSPALRCSPALDSGAGSSRSNSTTDSTTIYELGYCSKPIEFGPKPIDYGKSKRISPAPTTAVRQINLSSQSPARGTSPVSNTNHRPVVLAQNGTDKCHIKIPRKPHSSVDNPLAWRFSPFQQEQPDIQDQTSAEPPPPYPIIAPGVTNYSTAIQNRQSPTQSNSDYRKSPSSGIYSATSAGSPSPVPPSNSMSPHPVIQRSTNVCQLGSWQRKTHSPIIMQSVKSTQVQKPVLQTAIAPQVPASSSTTPTLPSYASSIQPHLTNSTSNPKLQQQQNNTPPTTPPVLNTSSGPSPPILNGNVHQASPVNNVNCNNTNTQRPIAVIGNNCSNSTNTSIIPVSEPPSYASTMAYKAAQQQPRHLPPPPYSNKDLSSSPEIINNNIPLPTPAKPQINRSQQQPSQQHLNKDDSPPTMPDLPSSKTNGAGASESTTKDRMAPMHPMLLSSSNHPPLPPTSSSSVKANKNNNVKSTISNVPSTATTKKLNKQPAAPPPSIAPKNSKNSNATTASTNSNKSPTNSSAEGCEKIKHESPIPERKLVSKEQEEVKEGRIKHYSPQAFKFFMEQHVENVIKSYKQRLFRKNQLEKEMGRINLSEEAQIQMRRMLNQKESNYIRLKRAKMEKSMFTKLKTIGVGAFGEVTLVQKIDTPNLLYAMKTLKKADVLKRNQVAHVKAERDILAEADNEWVVKLYYSFQDRDNLYFVMDYIPGGDLMSLLIKMGIFSEPLARFYIAELTVAVESVHKMGFIHRDIKPDNILIDKDGHIKLTDFGLCTGFRWTHDSKYYQKAGEHARQDSMEPWEDTNGGIKPAVLERRRQRDVQRCLAHSLVGTPNYIAPEVLARSGYTQLCDWWSVGVILYEMLVGQPPFLANTAVETQQKVINWEQTLHIPPQAELSKEATDLTLRLCSSSDQRLGKNSDEVKAHPFFNGINFGTDLRQQPAPHIPKIEYPTDTSNFDEVDPERIQNSDQFDAFSNNTAISFHGFYGFTYRRFFTDDKSNQECNDQDGPVYV